MLKSKKVDYNIANVKNYCESNKDFIKILELFSEGYIPTYNKQKVKLREEIQPFLKRNFFTWYFSETNQVSDISPALFINSQIYHKFGEDFVAVPIPEPVYKKSKLQNIKYRFHIFTMDDHPLVQDAKSLMDAIGKTKELEQVIEQVNFAFGKSHYLSFLLNICIEMGFIIRNAEEYKINEKKFAAFLTLSPKDKLHKMLSAHLNSFLNGLKNHKIHGKLPTLAKLIRILGECRDTDSFYTKAFPGLMSHFNNIMSFSGITDFDNIDIFNDGDNSLKEMMEPTMEMQMLISYVTSEIFICCVLYFQIIQPEYDSQFGFSELDMDYLALLPPANSGLSEDEIAQYKGSVSYVTYIKPPSNYSVSPIGAKLFNKNYTDGLYYSLVEPDEYDELLEVMLLNRAEIETEDYDEFPIELLGENFIKLFSK